VAKIIVKINPAIASIRYPPINAECDHVNEAPEVKSKAVFNNGIRYGLITSIPFGGQTAPISRTGLSEL
jgi:hypothetical protein